MQSTHLKKMQWRKKERGKAYGEWESFYACAWNWRFWRRWIEGGMLLVSLIICSQPRTVSIFFSNLFASFPVLILTFFLFPFYTFNSICNCFWYLYYDIGYIICYDIAFLEHGYHLMLLLYWSFVFYFA